MNCCLLQDNIKMKKNIVLYLKRMFIIKVFNIDWQIDKPVLQMNGSFFVETYEMRLD